MEGVGGTVRCYSGGRYGVRPTSFIWDGREREVKSVESDWLEPGGRHFLVRTQGDRLFELCYDEAADRWLIRERAAPSREGG